MNKSIFKLVVVGIALGTAAFFMPFFLIKATIIFIIFGAVFRFMGRGRGRHFAYADTIRNMSPEEYAAFKVKGQGRCSGSKEKN